MKLKSNGLNFCAEVDGSGSRLLFLGGTGWDLRLTPNPFQSLLAERFTLALFDQRGMGRSDKPDGPYSMLDYAQDAIGIMDALAWDHAHLVGYSFGGMVAQEVAIRWPARVGALVLAATSPGGKDAASYPVEELLGLSAYERARRGLEIADLRFTKEFQEAQPEKARQMVERRMLTQTRFITEPGARDGLAAQLSARASHDAADRLHHIRARTLILSGEHDGQVSRKGQAMMAERISDATCKTLPGGHNFIFENTDCYAEIAAFCGSQTESAVTTE